MIVDNGASSFLALNSYIKENEVLGILTDNPYFGEIRLDDRPFEEFKVYQEFSGQFHAVITIPQGNKATLSKDLEILFAKRQSFATAINSSQSIVMRSRLSRYWNDLVSVVEQAAIA